MKNKVQFLKSCGIGFTIVLALLLGTILIRNSNELSAYNNPLAFLAPLLFIPLLISVFYDMRYNCVDTKGEKKPKTELVLYKKNTCLVIVGTMLTITLIVSMIVLYYGW